MHSVWNSIINSYNYVFDELSHPRTKDLPFLLSPSSLLAILLTYNIFSIKIGPMMMKNRSAFNLMTTLKLYNICQVIVNIYLWCEGCRYLFSGNFNFKCGGIDETPDVEGRATSAFQLYVITKFVDLLDTVFYVLRKSDRQITFLHLYHHNFMVFFSWICLKYFPGGQPAVIGTINSLVHAFMYTYYLLSGMGPKYRKFLWWKKYLTVMQIVQFLIVLIHNFNSLFYQCSYPFVLKMMSCVTASIFIFMFSKFYYLNYIKEPAETRNKTCINTETTSSRPRENCENDAIGKSSIDSNRESNGNNYTYNKNDPRIKSKRI